MASKNTICLWYDGTAMDAARFYAETFPDSAVGAVMRARWNQASAAARARGDEGNRRLHRRWVGFLERRKRPTVANVAIARELAGWCWSLAVMDD